MMISSLPAIVIVFFIISAVLGSLIIIISLMDFICSVLNKIIKYAWKLLNKK